MQQIRLKLYRGAWYAVWREAGETRRRALRTASREAAERALIDFQRAVAAEAAGDAGTVAGIFPAYLEHLGEARAERPRWAWRRLEPAFGSLRPDQIDRPACRAYAASRRRAGAGDGTIWTELAALRAALRWANRRTPADIELPPKPPPQDRSLSRAEYDRLVAAADSPHVRLFIVLALATAGRMAAILELTWPQVDFERGLIRLGLGEQRRKGRATVPMTARARAALEAAAAARTSEYVIEWAGGRVGKVRHGFATAAVKAGIPWATPHVLRHTAATWMAEAGRPMSEIAQVLGHSDSRITERVYARYSPDYLRQAVAALE
jgi:integrase